MDGVCFWLSRNSNLNESIIKVLNKHMYFSLNKTMLTVCVPCHSLTLISSAFFVCVFLVFWPYCFDWFFNGECRKCKRWNTEISFLALSPFERSAIHTFFCFCLKHWGKFTKIELSAKPGCGFVLPQERYFLSLQEKKSALYFALWCPAVYYKHYIIYAVLSPI